MSEGVTKTTITEGKNKLCGNTIDIKYLTIRRGAHIQIYQYLTRNEQIQSFFILCYVIWRRKNHSYCIDRFPSEKWERREASRKFVFHKILLNVLIHSYKQQKKLYFFPYPFLMCHPLIQFLSLCVYIHWGLDERELLSIKVNFFCFTFCLTTTFDPANGGSFTYYVTPCYKICF